MTPSEEREMHELAKRLVALTEGVGWGAMRYGAIGVTMEKLAAYCAVCDCHRKRRAPSIIGSPG